MFENKKSGFILCIRKKIIELNIGIFIGQLFSQKVADNKLKMVCFDDEYARLRGINSSIYYYMLLTIISLSVIAMTIIVGIVLVIALMTLPAVTAALVSAKLWHCMLWASIICLFSVTLGFISSISWDLPTGPCIVMISSGLYLLTHIIVNFFKKPEGQTT